MEKESEECYCYRCGARQYEYNKECVACAQPMRRYTEQEVVDVCALTLKTYIDTVSSFEVMVEDMLKTHIKNENGAAPVN